jgi:hypothetical protein
MFVGKHRDDVEYLNKLWQYRYRETLTSSVSSLTANENLRYALRICTKANERDDPDRPIDAALIHRDVNYLERLLEMTFGTTRNGEYSISTDVMDVILRRNNQSIQQLSLYFQTATGSKLDEKIRKSMGLDEMTKKIAVHAVRTAIDPTYRDIMSLKDVISKSGREEDLAIRVCRSHWYSVHWNQIQAGWMGIVNGEFKDKVMKLQKGLFRDLIMAMTTGPSS